MTGTRYHALALATSVVTLALGVVVGVGPLSERQINKRDDQVTALEDQQAQLRDRLATLTDTAAGDRALAKTLAKPLTADRLADRSVVVVAAPHADPAVVRHTASVLRKAGATVTGTLSLTDVYVDPGKAQSPLEDLALRLVPPGVQFSDGATPIERVGTVLARATVTAADTAATSPDQDAAEVIAGLDELGALRLRGQAGQLAQLAVVVAGPKARGGPDGVTGARDALLGLVHALDRASHGAVVVGAPDAARPGRLVAQLRDTGPVGSVGNPSTVDSVDNPSTVDSAGSVGGDLALVLALAEQLDGKAGNYGRGAGATALLPAVAPPSP